MATVIAIAFIDWIIMAESMIHASGELTTAESLYVISIRNRAELN